MRQATTAVLLAVACAAAAVRAAPGHDNETLTRTPDQAEAGSETLSLVSQSGWRPLILTGGGGPQPQRLPRTPTYAAPPSAGDFLLAAAGPRENAQRIKDAAKRDVKGRDAQGDDQKTVQRNVVAFEGSASPTPSTPRAKKHQAPRDGPPPLPRPPPWAEAGPWGGQRVTPITEPDIDAEPVLGYRYPPPLPPPTLGPGPSPTAPFWEAAWLRRRERLLQELGLALPPGLCRCVPEGCGGLGLGLGPAGFDGGYGGRYRLSEPADPADLPYRLGVGAYGLYGWSRPLHNHNTAPLSALPLPLGTSRLHDSPN